MRSEFIEQALSARREYMTKDGQVVYGGPDPYAHLAATKQFRDSWLQAGPAPKHPGKRKSAEPAGKREALRSMS